MDIIQIRTAVDKYLAEKGYDVMDLRAVMFDMDGVLFDSMKNHAKSWYQTMIHFGYSDFTETEAYMHEGRTGAGTINIVKQRMYGESATEEEVQEMYKFKSELFNSLPKAVRMPGAYELLCQVKESGVVPMVVTGSGQKTLLERLNRNFPDIFRPELMVTAFDVKYGKPNPEPYLMGMKKFEKARYRDVDTSTIRDIDTSTIREIDSSRNRYFDNSRDRSIDNSKSRNLDKDITPANFIVVENAPLGVQSAVAAGVFTIAVNTGPLDDSILLGEGANLLFHSMQELSDNWTNLKQILLCQTK